jgi:hypothetical protein
MRIYPGSVNDASLATRFTVVKLCRLAGVGGGRLSSFAAIDTSYNKQAGKAVINTFRLRHSNF